MTEEHRDDETGEGVAVEEAKPKLKQPPMYKVLLMNDDYTPMDFVVHVLEAIFRMDRARATQVMLQVHTKGKAVCGTYTRDVAETKVQQVIDYARAENHPLMATMEQA